MGAEWRRPVPGLFGSEVDMVTELALTSFYPALPTLVLVPPQLTAPTALHSPRAPDVVQLASSWHLFSVGLPLPSTGPVVNVAGMPPLL